MNEHCPLCSAAPSNEITIRGKRRFDVCGGCGLVYARRAELPSAEARRERYLLHRNGSEDAGYCAFLRRAIDAALPHLRPGARGLDFGCGPAPTLSRLAEAAGIRMTDYDPLFRNVRLEPPYDVVFSTECFEHFDDPAAEMARIRGLLEDGGILSVMTEAWDECTDFERWHYASDPTHIAFYSSRTFDYVCRAFGFELAGGDGKRVFVFRKKSCRTDVTPVTESKESSR